MDKKLTKITIELVLNEEELEVFEGRIQQDLHEHFDSYMDHLPISEWQMTVTKTTTY